MVRCKKISNVQFTLDPAQQNEPLFFEKDREVVTEETKKNIYGYVDRTGFLEISKSTNLVVPDFELLYAGSLSPLERIYVDTNSGDTFIKELVPVDISVYTTSRFSNFDQTNMITDPIVSNLASTNFY
ncbi:MAG: hypothetical protein ACRCTJ_04395 [Brevinema sp.]